MHRCGEEIPSVNVFSECRPKPSGTGAGTIEKGTSFTRADKSPKRIALEPLGSLCRDGRKPVLSEAERIRPADAKRGVSAASRAQI